MSSAKDPSPHPAKTQTCQNTNDDPPHLHKPLITNHQSDHAVTSPLVTSRVVNEDTRTNKDASSHQTCSETAPLLEKTGTQVYGRRWYVLAVFCLGGVIQGAGSATWGPITQSSKLVFSWSDGYVALQPLWGNLTFALIMGPVTWLTDVKGLRVSMLFCSVVLVVGFGLRCITSEPSVATWATATAIASAFSYVGVALSFIIGPELVPEPPNVTSIIPTSITPTDGSSVIKNITDAVDFSPQRDAIMRLMYYEAGAAGLLLLLVVIYFPSTPPLPPSRSAAATRTQYRTGLKALAKNSRFWILILAYSPVGTYGAFGGVLDIDLNPTGISQKLAGWMGFYATIGGCVAALVASRIADLFMRRLKLLLLLLYVGAAASLVWFCLLVLQYIPFNIPSVYASIILTGVFINGSVPLFYEAVCEVSYPVAEGLTTGTVTIANNVVGVVFIGLLLIPGIGVVWMNWALLASVLAALPLLLMVRQHYAHIDLDTMEIDLNRNPPDHFLSSALTSLHTQERVAWMNWALLASVLAALPLLLMVRQHYARIDLDTMDIDVPDPEPA